MTLKASIDTTPHHLNPENPPIFVVGCARSGTTLLYHTLLSSGGFAVYLAEPAVFDMLVPKFKDLGVLNNRINLLKYWLDSKMFRASGLQRKDIEAKILSQCKSNGDFLLIMMQEIARSQEKDRWAVWGPDNLLYIRQIKNELPGAKFIHIIRDGRDVALSLSKEGWIRPLLLDPSGGLLVAALHWRWKVNRGRKYGQSFVPYYMEVRFEDLLCKREETLLRISEFIGFDLDPEVIQKNPVGTLKDSNSTFRSTVQQNQPIGRWKTLLSRPEVDLLQSVLGPTLLELGYEVVGCKCERRDFGTEFMKIVYPAFLDAKLWCKKNTPLGRFVDMSRLRREQQIVWF